MQISFKNKPFEVFNVQAVLFDLDGTLVVNLPGLSETKLSE